MAIWLDHRSKVLVQGMTGSEVVVSYLSFNPYDTKVFVPFTLYTKFDLPWIIP